MSKALQEAFFPLAIGFLLYGLPGGMWINLLYFSQASKRFREGGIIATAYSRTSRRSLRSICIIQFYGYVCQVLPAYREKWDSETYLLSRLE